MGVDRGGRAGGDPDGRVRTVDQGRTEWFWDLAAGGPPRVYRDGLGDYNVRSPGVLPDGMIPGPTREFGLSLFDPTGDRPARVVYPGGTAQVWAVHPDGRLLAVARRTGGVALWDYREEAEVCSVPLAGRAAVHLAFDPTGRRLAGTDTVGNVFILDAPPEK